MYTVKNYKNRKAIAEDFAKGIAIEVYQEGPFAKGPANGPVSLEGPHYPKPHSWYVTGIAVNGILEMFDGKSPDQWAAKIAKDAAKKAEKVK